MAADHEFRNGGELGAYGLRIEGLQGAEGLLVRADSSWPELQIVTERGSIEGFAEHVDSDRATFVLLGAVAVAERSPGRAVFTFDGEPNLQALVHPYLAPIAGLFAHWHRRESLHAGAFVARGGAWGVLAERSGGKSSTLARLALDGVPIVTDDVLIVEDRTAFAGPRAIDLREEPAQALGIGEPLGVLGARDRWRMRLADVGGAFELKGWVFLEWGDELAVTRVSAGSRLQRLAAQRTIRLAPPDPSALLRLSALPAFELRRPRDWSSLEEATTLLLASLP
jgi:hypothetical protein